MAENAGRIFYEVDADTSGLLKAEREIDTSTGKARDSMGRFQKSTKAANDELGRMTPVARGVRAETERLATGYNQVARAATIAAGALAVIGVTQGISSAIQSVATFEQTMLGLQVVSGATARQMEDLEAQARELGATSMFSAQQAGEAQRFLAQAGFEVNEVLSATPGILQLATAAQIDLAQAADIASNVLGGMQLPVSELARVNDVLAATAAGANTNVSQLGQALSFAAPFAAAAGISIEEASAAIGTLSDSGLQASRAGTGLVGVIRQLSNVTDAGAEALSKYGLSADDVNIETEGLATVLERLRDANISTGDAFKIFGSEAGAAGQILAAGADRVEEFTGELNEAAGAAENAAIKLGSGLVGSMRTLQSVVSESILQLGDSGLASALQTVIDTASGVIAELNGMGDVFADVNNLTEEQRARLQTLAAAVEAFGTALQVAAALLAGRFAQALATSAAGMVTMATTTIRANGALVAMRTTMMSLFGPVGIVVAAAGILYTFRRELGLVDQAAIDAANSVKQLQAATNDYRNELRGLTAEQLNNRRVETVTKLQEETQALKETQAAVTAAEEAYAKLSEQTDQAGSFQMFDVDPDVVNGVEEANKAFEAQRQTVAELGAQIGQIDDQFRMLNETQVDAIEPTETTATTIANVGSESEESGGKVDDFASSLQSLLDKLFPLEAQQRKLLESQLLLHQALAKDAISTAQFEEAMIRLERPLVNAWEAYELFKASVAEPPETDGFEQWIEMAKQNLDSFEDTGVKAADTFVDSFGNMFADVLTGEKSFADSFVGIIQDMAGMVLKEIGKMIAQWIVLQAVQAGADSAGGGWGALASSFAGAFDKGGTIKQGQWGIVGENGPEIVQGPASVIGREDTANMMAAPSAGDMVGRTAGRQAPAQALSVNVTLVEDPNRAGETEQRQSDDNTQVDIDAFVADIYGDGPRAQAIQDRWQLEPRGT